MDAMGSMENSDISSREILDPVRKIIEEDDPPQPSAADAICNNVSSFLYLFGLLKPFSFSLYTRSHHD
jgi:hypothetical protein